VTADISERRSPLSAFADRFAQASDTPARIRLREIPFLTQLTLRTETGTAASGAASATLGLPLPVVPNTTRSRRDLSVLWMGPDEWLLVAEQDGKVDQPALERAVEGHHATVVDVSAQRTVIEVAGADARELLLKGCALDLHPQTFAVGRCAQTNLARTQVVLLSRDREPVYWVFVRASFAEYLAEWLIDAAAEYRGAAPSDLSLQQRPAAVPASA
jgi:sarcosine oxidase subunit gamma